MFVDFHHFLEQTIGLAALSFCIHLGLPGFRVGSHLSCSFSVELHPVDVHPVNVVLGDLPVEVCVLITLWLELRSHHNRSLGASLRVINIGQNTRVNKLLFRLLLGIAYLRHVDLLHTLASASFRGSRCNTLVHRVSRSGVDVYNVVVVLTCQRSLLFPLLDAGLAPLVGQELLVLERGPLEVCSIPLKLYELGSVLHLVTSDIVDHFHIVLILVLCNLQLLILRIPRLREQVLMLREL